MNFELNPFLYSTSEDEMADGLEKFLAAMLEESIAFCGGRETDARRTLEQTAKRLGFTYEALMQGAADGTAVGRVVAQVKREHPAFATRN